MTDKYRHKLPKEQLKKFARETNKKLVASDYKNHRVEDPTHISTKQEKKVKVYVKTFFDRAVQKYQDYEKRKAASAARHTANGTSEAEAKLDSEPASSREELANLDDEIVLTDDEAISPASSERKRKREDEDVQSPSLTPSETPSLKRLKEEEVDVASPPPPPPPPPESGLLDTAMMGDEDEEVRGEEDEDEVEETEEERRMREQEEALIRENEEAQRLEDEAERHKMREQEEALQRENEEAMRDFERSLNQRSVANSAAAAANGVVLGAVLNGTGTPMDAQEGDGSNKDGRLLSRKSAARKREVLGH